MTYRYEFVLLLIKTHQFKLSHRFVGSSAQTITQNIVRTPGSVDISISNNLEDEPGDIQNQFVLKRPEILGKYKKMRIRSTRHNCLTAKHVAVRGLWTQSRMDPIDVSLTSFFLHSPHHCVAQFEWLILVLCAVYFALVSRIISLNSLLRALPYARLSLQCHGVVCVLVS